MSAVVLVPVKDFATAKLRLAPALAEAERAALARTMAARVIQCSAPLPVHVVCDDPDVKIWAQEQGAQVIWAPGLGLNGAVSFAFRELREIASEVVVAHADLPLAAGFTGLTGFAGVTVVPDRREDGTNVLVVPTAVPFPFSYGPGSFRRHVALSEAVGVGVRVCRRPELAWDVDLPADLTYTSP